jgi:hypothetical protein
MYLIFKETDGIAICNHQHNKKMQTKSSSPSWSKAVAVYSAPLIAFAVCLVGVLAWLLFMWEQPGYFVHEVFGKIFILPLILSSLGAAVGLYGWWRIEGKPLMELANCGAEQASCLAREILASAAGLRALPSMAVQSTLSVLHSIAIMGTQDSPAPQHKPIKLAPLWLLEGARWWGTFVFAVPAVCLWLSLVGSVLAK